MLDLAHTMFYKAKMDIKGNPGDDVLWSVVLLVRNWALYKARRDHYSLPSDIREWSDFKKGSTMQSEDSAVDLTSVLHVNDGVFTWAARYRERSREKGLATRDWITEIGFEGRSESEGSVSIIVSYYDSPGFIGDVQQPPSSSIPKLVKMILNAKNVTCFLSGIEISNRAIEFDKKPRKRSLFSNMRSGT